ncbi:UDP-N-acetylmuramoylalanyl-D-glutamyl-2,6-diaminopimelate--D-alanyl-D-alanine ligase [Bartonella tamiae]|uniref:UDP-N-acetylmuramoyl-tripeptide--D-alanyl-D-alanine ligase n=1 Tax=Bartonella tamiae Th239 TaxID=1094558 RepID=J0R0M7_9HYPH|nr:UDP-N-acetylmuramoylalanyl-D-glutamyl-2,6-diaminopimelate--D-alanyl-D-alanine ligase [Bartonella tamiae]EJF89069.1 UDP-N-acetylmuramoyl-tripeptide-D-alanyl-D-alanine ligase [Bartonella tamiae Th239]
MSALWTSSELADALKGEVTGKLSEEFHGISIDSRTAQKGDIFFCIKGDQFDGHDFAQKAIENGASVLIVHKNRTKSLYHLATPMIAVDDVLQGLQNLAKAARLRSKAKIIAITGSVGKTTTKELLRQSLATVGKVHANPLSFNNHWGVPLTLARMPKETDYGVFEIGMNHANEIRPLVKLVRPDVAIVTQIAAVHLGFFSSLEDIADAKAEIFEGMNDNGIVFLNADDAFFSYLRDKALLQGVQTIWCFGEAAFADYRLEKLHMMSDSSVMKILIRGEEAMVKVGAPGRHIVQNCLAVIGACDNVGANLAKIFMALADFKAENGRGARYRLMLPKGGYFTLIDESYNANPASMRAALELLKATPKTERGRHIAVLGDMLELGAHSHKLHLELLEPIEAAEVNPIYLIGHEMEALAQVLSKKIQTTYKHNANDCIEPLVNDLLKDDIIMVKSSNSIGASRIVAALLERYKQHPDDLKKAVQT